MKILISERLSQHKYKTPEGYLICTDAILARTGKQQYSKDELFNDGDLTEVDVDRPYDEVFDNATIASFENKPITVEHPNEEVNVGNYKDYAVGYVRDVRQDKTDEGQDVILGNLVITDQQTINEIEEGKHTNLSCGYDCDIIKGKDGGYIQHKIRGNHVALCECPRAGITKIIDSKVNDSINVINFMGNKHLIEKMKNMNDKTIKEIRQILNQESEFNPNMSDNDIKEVARRLKVKIKDEFKPFFFKEDEDYWEDEAEYVGNQLKVEEFMDKYDNYDEFINSEFTAEVLGSYGNSRENQEMKKYFEQKWPQKAKLAHRLFDSLTKDVYLGTNNNVLSKMDAIKELKTARIAHEERWDAGNENKGWYVQIQNVGSDEVKIDRNTKTVTRKEKSYAWGRIWYNGKHMFTTEAPLMVARTNMIHYLEQSSIKDAMNAMKILNSLNRKEK